MKIGCKIESVVGVNFKKLLAKIMNLIFKYILSSYFIEYGWRCSIVTKMFNNKKNDKMINKKKRYERSIFESL